MELRKIPLMPLACVLTLFFLAGVGLVSAGESEGGTQLMIRAVSHDAKVIGTKVGGARIMVKNLETGEILAEGLQEGGTGSTERIIINAHRRHASIYDTPGTAGFLATLSIEQPTVVEITAEGPLGYPQCSNRAVKTMLVVPGSHVLGDGVLLEIHGFCVSILSPDDDAILRSGEEYEVRATVIMA